MSLGGVLSIATSGLSAIQGQIALVSQNVANANSAGYTEEIAANTALVNGDQGNGVVLGAATRVTAPALQTGLYAQNATVAAQSVLSSALGAITSVEGSTDASTGSSGSLTDLLSTLQGGFTTLQADPASSAQQQVVVQAAQNLVSGINSLAQTYATQRQAASDAIGSGVTSINQELATLGSLSNQIVSLRSMNQSTAGLEDERQTAMTALSNQVAVKFSQQPSGDMLVTTRSGVTLPTHATNGPLSYDSTTLTAKDSYDGSGTTVRNIMLDGQDVTGLLGGGALGANISLRDSVIPGYTAQLDSFSATVAQRFDSSGLPLFTDGSGAVPSSSKAPPVGFSSDVQVNSSASGLLSGSGAGGVAALSSLVSQIDIYTFGADSSAGIAWPSVQSTGLGAGASLLLPYSGTGSLSDFASRLTSAQGADAQNAQTNLANETAVQSSIANSINDVSGVSIDTEMSKMVSLQNSYQANAKVIAAVQSMFSSLLSAVGTTG
jgi:flagellar hook-associated protein 1 FlgK